MRTLSAKVTAEEVEKPCFVLQVGESAIKGHQEGEHLQESRQAIVRMKYPSWNACRLLACDWCTCYVHHKESVTHLLRQHRRYFSLAQPNRDSDQFPDFCSFLAPHVQCSGL